MHAFILNSGWTLHSAPAPAHPSYRLITALRLYHAFPAGAGKLESNTDSEATLDMWRGVVNGERASVSDENEALCRETLFQLCQKIEEEAARRIASLASLAKARDDETVEESLWYILQDTPCQQASLSASSHPSSSNHTL